MNIEAKSHEPIRNQNLKLKKFFSKPQAKEKKKKKKRGKEKEEEKEETGAEMNKERERDRDEGEKCEYRKSNVEK